MIDQVSKDAVSDENVEGDEVPCRIGIDNGDICETAEEMSAEYCGNLESSSISGNDVKILVREDSLRFVTLLDEDLLMYKEINSFEVIDYALHIISERGKYVISHMGKDMEGLMLDLKYAYDSKVREALFVTGNPVITIEGEYEIKEREATFKGIGTIEIYPDSVCILPAADHARRIPLCFVDKIENGDYRYTLGIEDDRYSFIRLGNKTNPFIDALNKAFSGIRERSVKAVLEICPGLTSGEVAKIAREIPEGVAVPMGRIKDLSQKFYLALEKKIMDSRAAESYTALTEICDPNKISVGTKPWSSGENAENMIWMIAPVIDAGIAITEFAVNDDSAAATFVYHFKTDADIFLKRLNRAMEAIKFKREIVRLTDADLNTAKYANYAMSAKRTPSVIFLRNSFLARIIHSDRKSWKQEVQKYINEGGV